MRTKPRKRDKVVVAIAILKLLKGLLLLAVAVGAIKLLHKDLGDELTHWIRRLNVDIQNPFFQSLLAKTDGITPEKMAWLSVGTFVYSGLFLTEGIGLLLQQRWAEYFTIIITGSFLPFEIYEIAVKEFSVFKLVLLITNAAIFVYLIWRLKHEHKRR